MYSTKKHRRKLGICPNCNHILQPEDNFCSSCGQENHDLKVPLGHLIYEFIESIFHFDIKVWETLRAIVTRPGKVITDFNEGRRARYVPPARLYIFISVIFFFLAGKGVDDGIKKGEKQFFKLTEQASRIKWDTRVDFEDLPENILDKKLPSKVSEKLETLSYSEKIAYLDSYLRKATQDTLARYGSNFGNLDTTGLMKEIGLSLDMLKAKIPAVIRKDSLDKMRKNVVEIRDDIYIDSLTVTRAYGEPMVMDSILKAHHITGRFKKMEVALGVKLNMYQYMNQREKSGMIRTLMQKALKYISFMMFVLMPVVALILALFYIRKKKYYFEHFIFSVMTHSVIFMIFSVAIILSWWIHSPWLNFFTMLISFLYIVSSLKYVYGGGWLKTLLKFSVMFSIYTALLVIIIGGVFGYTIIV